MTSRLCLVRKTLSPFAGPGAVGATGRGAACTSVTVPTPGLGGSRRCHCAREPLAINRRENQGAADRTRPAAGRQATVPSRQAACPVWVWAEGLRPAAAAGRLGLTVSSRCPPPPAARLQLLWPLRPRPSGPAPGSAVPASESLQGRSPPRAMRRVPVPQKPWDPTEGKKARAPQGLFSSKSTQHGGRGASRPSVWPAQVPCGQIGGRQACSYGRGCGPGLRGLGTSWPGHCPGSSGDARARVHPDRRRRPSWEIGSL